VVGAHVAVLIRNEMELFDYGNPTRVKPAIPAMQHQVDAV